MKLTDNQEKILKDNMGLVGKVIKDKVEIYNILNKAKSSAPPSTAMGIDALILSSRGYTAKDIGMHYGKSANTITALISKARKHLKGIPELCNLHAI